MAYKMVVVDDEVFIRKSICEYDWEVVGVEVVGSFQNFEQTIKFIQENSVDIVLTDICMPDVSGLQLVEWMKHFDKRIKVICISGYDDYTYLRSAFKAGADDYILKPINKKALYDVIMSVLVGKNAEFSTETSKPDSPNEIGNYQINRVIDYLEKNYMKPITLESVAKQVNLNSTYLSFLFKKIMGHNFSDYLDEYRISVAMRLLRESSYNISEIAYQTGYKEQRYFSERFKKRVGVTPSEYRKTHLEF